MKNKKTLVSFSSYLQDKFERSFEEKNKNRQVHLQMTNSTRKKEIKEKRPI